MSLGRARPSKTAVALVGAAALLLVAGFAGTTRSSGGTTAKASAVIDGLPIERPQTEIGGGANVATRFFGSAGHLVRVQSLDIVEVGAGGGSIAWIDGGGGLRVGPEGAGAGKARLYPRVRSHR